MLSRLCILLVFSLTMTGCTISHQVARLDENHPSIGDGVPYTLPRTVINVDVPVTKLVYKAGRYADQAKDVGIELPEKLSALVQGVTGNSDDELETALAKIKTPPSISLGDPKLSTTAESDPDQVFLIKVGGGAFEDRVMNLTLSPQGFLIKGDAETKDRSLEFATKTFETAAGIAGKLIKIGAAEANEKVPKTRLEKATKIVDAIKEIRGKRLLLASGQNIYVTTPEAIKLMLSELGSMEEQLLSNFRKKVINTGTIHCEIRPKAEGTNTLFSFEEDMGIYKSDDSAVYTYIPSDFIDSKAIKKKAELRIILDPKKQFSSVVKSAWPDENGSCVSCAKKKGFFYRIPGQALIELRIDGDIESEQRIPIAQLGTIAWLPVDVTHGSRSKYSVGFSPETGAVLSIGFESSGIDPSSVSTIGSSIGGVIDAVGAKSAADAAARAKQKTKGEKLLEQLQLERQILEERKKIHDLMLSIGN